jgi:hypothetical protein
MPYLHEYHVEVAGGSAASMTCAVIEHEQTKPDELNCVGTAPDYLAAFNI